jgi:hypothetical protein
MISGFKLTHYRSAPLEVDLPSNLTDPFMNYRCPLRGPKNASPSQRVLVMHSRSGRSCRFSHLRPLPESSATLASYFGSFPSHGRLTIPKLQHDLEQFEYLQRRGILAEQVDPIMADL